MVHLSKADVENFDTFICIEEPAPLKAPPHAPRLPIPSPIPSPPGILRLLLVIFGCDVS